MANRRKIWEICQLFALFSCYFKQSIWGNCTTVVSWQWRTYELREYSDHVENWLIWLIVVQVTLLFAFLCCCMEISKAELIRHKMRKDTWNFQAAQHFSVFVKVGRPRAWADLTEFVTLSHKETADIKEVWNANFQYPYGFNGNRINDFRRN